MTFLNTDEVNAVIRKANKNIFNPFAGKVIKSLFLGEIKV